MPLTPTADRFARQLVLPGFGARAQQRLADARVVVVGAGGLGSALLPVLVAAGVGEVLVVDDDVVDPTNLHRQTLYGFDDVGAAKARVAEARLTPLAPGTVVRGLVQRLDAASADAVVDGATLLVDATDDLAARYVLDDAAAAAGIPLVWGSATGTAGQVGVADAAHGPRWRDLFPVQPGPADVVTCAVGGVLPSLCTTVGGLMATEVLKMLTGTGRPLIGRMLVVDALAGSVRELAYGSADATPAPMTKEIRMTRDDEISPTDAAALLASDTDVQLLDVREPWEAEIATLPAATLIPLGQLPGRLGELDADREVIAYCHGGVRSLEAAQVLQAAGFRVRSMVGGIDAWSRTVDPGVARY